jgi:effector-binding domain-containing protein
MPGLECEVLPGGRVVETLHIGSHGQLPLARNALFAPIHGRGLCAHKPPYARRISSDRRGHRKNNDDPTVIPVQEGTA